MAKLCYYADFGTKIPTTKHEIMPHAMSVKDGSRMSTTAFACPDSLGRTESAHY